MITPWRVCFQYGNSSNGRADSFFSLFSFFFLLSSHTVRECCVAGLETYRTCQSGDIATRNVVQMMEKFRVLSGDTQDVNSTTPLLGSDAYIAVRPDYNYYGVVVCILKTSQ